MSILGIDFGKRKIGLSISEGYLASPYSTLQFQSLQQIASELQKIINKEGVDLLVIGLPSPDRIGAEKFGQKLAKLLNIQVEFIDETLTTQEAQKLRRKASKEDELAASLILQSYLSHEEKN